jgi:glycine cleavage system H protein
MPPDDRRYTDQHEWVLVTGDPARVRVGITAYAAEQLGDVVYVSLPEVGQVLTASSSFGEVESTKSVSDLFAPVSGTVAARNDDLDNAPETVNTDPYGAGWMVEIVVDDPAAIEALMDADAYAALTA